MSTNSRRARKRHHRASKRGQAPGTVIYIGEANSEPVAVHVLDYDLDGVRPFEELDEEVCQRAQALDSVTWINLDGIHQVDHVKAIAKTFDLHALWVEDLVNTSCRPRSEVIDDKVLVIAKMATVRKGPTGSPEVETEHVGLVCGPGWVLTFQERPGDVWDSVRQRIDHGSRIRKMSAAYLLHGLLDAIVDEYFVVLENLELEVDRVEEASLNASTGDLPPRVFAIRSEITAIRSVVWPVREAVGQLVRGDYDGIDSAIQPFYRDLYDHLVQTMDITDASRERLVGVVELHLAVTSHQMNVVMRVLTVVSTVFIPLTFIAGVYGMNFAYMPELQVRGGYFVALGVMLAIGLSLLWMFRRRGWI